MQKAAFQNFFWKAAYHFLTDFEGKCSFGRAVCREFHQGRFDRGELPVHCPLCKPAMKQDISELSLRCNALSGKLPDILPDKVRLYRQCSGRSLEAGSAERELPEHCSPHLRIRAGISVLHLAAQLKQHLIQRVRSFFLQHGGNGIVCFHT